jgi:hypothetical protein
VPLYEGLEHGGSSVEEGDEELAIMPFWFVTWWPI